MSQNSFGAKDTLDVEDRRFEIFRLDALQHSYDVARLPFSLKVLLENLLRTEGNGSVSAADIEALASWDAKAKPSREIAFTHARVLMQDFTGVPAVVTWRRCAMRWRRWEATRHGSIRSLPPSSSSTTPSRWTPSAPATPSASTPSASSNETASATPSCAGVRAPSTTSPSSHPTQASSTRSTSSTSRAWSSPMRDPIPTQPQAYPDTLVGTDSHTTMINGLGVLGWGVGGIEAEAAMLGQPMSMLIPQVLGFELRGGLPEGATATDLVLTVTQMLRERGVVGMFVEFYGPGLAGLPIADRATIGTCRRSSALPARSSRSTPRR